MDTPIEYPAEHIKDTEYLACQREVIAAKRNYADELECDEEKTPSCASLTRSERIECALAELLRAEARLAEIALHNQLWQVGQAIQQAQRQQGGIIVPNLVPGSGRRQ